MDPWIHGSRDPWIQVPLAVGTRVARRDQAIGTRKGVSVKAPTGDFGPGCDADDYDFADFPFALPKTMMSHDVVIAFGTRTVLSNLKYYSTALIDFRII